MLNRLADWLNVNLQSTVRKGWSLTLTFITGEKFDVSLEDLDFFNKKKIIITIRLRFRKQKA